MSAGRPCQRCGSPTRIQVQATIEAPSELAHQFSKANMRRADVHFMGVLWETMDTICTNPKCMNVTDGYGNYVTKLAKRVKELESELEKYRAVRPQLSLLRESIRAGLRRDDLRNPPG